MGYWEDNPDLVQLASPVDPRIVALAAGNSDSGSQAAPQGPSGYDRMKFQEAWGALPSHTAADLRKLIADNPSFASGITLNSQDKVTMPGYTEPGTGIYRGPENLDLIRDVGGANAWGWGGYGPGSASAGGGGAAASGGMPAGGTGGGNVNLPIAPVANPLTAPDPFTYQPSSLGNFNGGPQATYTPMDAPEKISAEQYNGLYGGNFSSDPSYQNRLKTGADILQGSAATKGVLRTGNTAKALVDYGQNAASAEWAAEDARRRANVAQNNASNLAFNGQNFNQGFQTNQANNAGNLAANGQNFNQSLAGFNANQGAQNQNFQQALAAYGQNAGTGLAYGSQNQNNALANYQAQVNAALGQGNLNLGFQNSNNSYALGQGSLGVQQGQLGLAQQGQNFNQGLASWQQNYQANVLDPWNMNLQLANLGNPGAPNGQGNANAQSDLITQGGNAAAAGGVGAANAVNGALSNLVGLSNNWAAYYGTQPGQNGATTVPYPGYGVYQ